MKTTDFARHLTDYLSIYLPGQRNLSSHTIASYRDTFKLLLIFCEHEKGIPPESLTLAHMNDDLILAFITWIETTRNCSISTRNQRLAAIHAFFRYIQAETPERLLINRVRGSFSLPLPTPPGMRVRTGRFPKTSGP